MKSTLRRRNLYVSLLLLVAGFLLFPCAGLIGSAQASEPSDIEPDSVQKVILSGGIKHADQLAPIKPALRAGSKFDQRSLADLAPQDIWYQIPPWLAGLWQRNEQNLLKHKSLGWKSKLKSTFYPTKMGLFKSRTQYRWGHQYDNLGRVWNYVRFPYVARVDGSRNFTIQYVRKAVPIRVTGNRVVIKFLSTSHEIDRRTGLIVRAEQAEALSMYSPVNDRTLHASFSRKIFDSSGKAKSVQVSESYIHRLSNFYPLNFADGKDLRISLNRFLQALYARAHRPAPPRLQQPLIRQTPPDRG